MSDGRRLPWMSGLILALLGAAWYAAVVLGAVGVEIGMETQPEPVGTASP